MIVTIIEGGELSYTLARIFLLFNHRVNIIRQESEANMSVFNELEVNNIAGVALDVDVLSQPCVEESDVFIVLMDTDLDNLEVCLFIKNNFNNKKVITRVNNSKYAGKFEQIGIDIAIDGAFIALNTIIHIERT